MTMPAPSSAPPPYYPQKRGYGCLWGCLGLLALLFLPVILAGAYGTWFLHDGYRRDPVLRVVGELVREEGMAHLVLGDGVVITGVEGNSFSWVPGLASHGYVVTLQGTKGEGQLAVTSHAGSSGPKLDSAILTGPDGRRYDLLKHMALPGDGENSAPGNSI
jgi:hypothetical protein